MTGGRRGEKKSTCGLSVGRSWSTKSDKSIFRKMSYCDSRQSHIGVVVLSPVEDICELQSKHQSLWSVVMTRYHSTRILGRNEEFMCRGWVHWRLSVESSRRLDGAGTTPMFVMTQASANRLVRSSETIQTKPFAPFVRLSCHGKITESLYRHKSSGM